MKSWQLLASKAGLIGAVVALLQPVYFGAASSFPSGSPLNSVQVVAANDDFGAGFVTNEDTAFTTANVLENDSRGETDSIQLTAFDGSATKGEVNLFTSGGAGDLDITFGQNGWLPFTDPFVPDPLKLGNTALVPQPDGKLLFGSNAVGSSFEDERMTVIRYLADGKLDTSFGTSGWAIVDRLPYDPPLPWFPFDSLTLQADGKILVLGHNLTCTMIARLNADGSNDTSFGTDGKLVIINGGERFASMAVQAGGRILVAFQQSRCSSSIPCIEVVAFTDEGLPDASFGTGGRKEIRFESADDVWIHSIVVQPDERILLGGVIKYPGSYMEYALVGRLTANGGLDPGLDQDGLLIFGGRASLNDLKVLPQSDGKILVNGAGYTNLLWRLNSDGSMDSSFGAGGLSESDTPFVPVGLALQSDGKVLVAGLENSYYLHVMRFTSSGQVDGLFGENGVVGGVYVHFNMGKMMALQPNGKIVYGTTDGSDGQMNAFLKRIHPEPFALFHYAPGGKFDYLKAGETTTDSFVYSIQDEGGEYATEVIITITGVNDAPAVTDGAAITSEDTALQVDLTGADAEGDALSYSVDGQPAHGILTGKGPNLTYTPVSDWHGMDYFTYKASDGSAESNTATVSIQVNPVNDAPNAQPLPDITRMTGREIFVRLSGFSDTEGDALVYSARLAGGASLPAWLSIDPPTGNLQGTPKTTDAGNYPIQVTASDGHGGSAVVSFMLTVISESDPVMTVQSYLPLIRQ